MLNELDPWAADDEPERNNGNGEPIWFDAAFVHEARNFKRDLAMVSGAATKLRLIRNQAAIWDVKDYPRGAITEALMEAGAALDDAAVENAIRDGLKQKSPLKSVLDAAKKRAGAKSERPLPLPADSIELLRASEVKMKAVIWLWLNRFARGKQSIIGGDPGLGKSTLLAYIAAQISCGGPWPDGSGRAPIGNIIYLTAEDTLDDTVVPRLVAAGADLSRIYFCTMTRMKNGRKRMFSLLTDLELLESKIREVGNVIAVIFDPMSAYFGNGRLDSHNNTELRSVLGPISDLAERHNVAVLSNGHLNKTGDTRALMRFMGSLAFVAQARCAYLAIEEMTDGKPTGRVLFLEAKNNLGPKQGGLAYRILQTVVEDSIVTSYVHWDAGPVTVTANQALAATTGGGQSRHPAQDEAAEFLGELLADGPMWVKELQKEAQDAGISWATIRRVQDRLIEITRDKETRRYFWSLKNDEGCSGCSPQKA
jgi:putative DNA primase/helicase